MPTIRIIDPIDRWIGATQNCPFSVAPLLIHTTKDGTLLGFTNPRTGRAVDMIESKYHAVQQKILDDLQEDYYDTH